jgi:precorrin-3B synthase
MSREVHNAARAAAPRPRGACPRLSEPMETGDGLLVRIVPSGRIGIDAFASLCVAARTHGNGLMEITGRGSIQIRGLTEISAQHLATTIEALDIPFNDRIPVAVSALPGATGTRIRPDEIAAQLRDMAHRRRLDLAPKVSVVIDDGGPISLDALAADIHLRALSGTTSPWLHVSIGGDIETAAPLGIVSAADAAQLTVDLLAVLAAGGTQARARDLVAQEGVGRFLKAAGDLLETALDIPAARTTETIGLHRLDDDSCAIGVALPFGQAHALDLIALARIARANGAEWAALAPQRTLLLGPIGEMTAFALGTAADTLGFVVDARDPRRRIAACAGAPLCASGHIPARELAARIAERLPQGKFSLHISGCSKGCAHPRPAPLTILGIEQGAGFIDSYAILHLPRSEAYSDDLVEEVARKIVAESEDA